MIEQPIIPWEARMIEQPIIPHGQPGTYYAIIKQDPRGNFNCCILKRTDLPRSLNYILQETVSDEAAARMFVSNALARLRKGLIWEVIE